MSGLMDEYIKETGLIAKCTVKEHAHGQMEESMLVSMFWTRRKDKECTCGLMGESMKDNGRMENRADEASI